MTQQIKFFSDDEVAVNHFPPVPASKSIPDWYRDLPLRLDDEVVTAQKFINSGYHTPFSIKGCVPVSDYITSGYVIRASADIIITPEKTGGESGFVWGSRQGACDVHQHKQCPVSMRGQRHHYIKLMTPWRVATPAGYSCYFYQPEFMLNENIRLFPAVVDTDGYNNAVNFPGVITTDQTFTICAGDPLMVVFPFKRQDWDHTVSLATEPKNPTAHFLERGYKKLFHNQKRYR
jgi:hypothetical protein